MARTAWPTVASGDSWSASQHNTYGRDNDLAYWVFTTAGDMAYATDSANLARVAMGGANYIFRVNAAGTAPEWASLLTGAAIYRSTNQTIANNSQYVTVSYDTVLFDDASYYGAGQPTRLTMPATGHYLVGSFMEFASLSATCKHVVLKNGAATLAYREWHTTSSPFEQSICALVSLSSGDYIETGLFQNSGVSQNCLSSGSNAYPILYAVRVR